MGNNDKTINQLKNKAITKGNSYLKSKRSSVEIAIQLGRVLNQVKSQMKGGFEKWVVAKMPVSKTQCHTFRKLADKRDDEWLKVHSDELLSINCERKLTEIGDIEKEREIRDWARDNKATQAATLEYINKSMGWEPTALPVTTKNYISRSNKSLEALAKLNADCPAELKQQADEIEKHITAIRKLLNPATKQKNAAA